MFEFGCILTLFFIMSAPVLPINAKPTMFCSICQRSVPVQSRRKGLGAHIEHEHPEHYANMKRSGGMAAKTIVQHEIDQMMVQADAAQSAPPKTPNPASTLTDEQRALMPVMCVICGLHFPSYTSKKEIGFHYSSCYRRSLV